MSEITISLIKTLRECTGAGIMDCKKSLVEADGDIELAISSMRKLGQIKAFNKINRIATEGIIMAEVFSDNKLGILLELNCETDFIARNFNFITFSNEVLQTVVSDRILNINDLRSKFKEQREELIAKVGENINISRLEILEGKKIGYYLHGVRIGVLVSIEGANDEFTKYIAMHITASNPKYITPADIPSNIIRDEYQIEFDTAIQSGKSHEIAKKIATGKIKKFIDNVSLVNQPFIMDTTKTIGLLLKEINAKVINFIRFELGEKI